MNLDKITQNECSNDGTKIHLYYSAEAEMWISFGYSAFILTSIVQNESINHIDNFSVQLQMPSIIINNTTLKKVSTIHKTIKVNKEQYVIVFGSNCVNAEEYREWTTALRGK
ncbi:MAG: hypothetical protein RR061_05560 [Muribaculaceae bacterium]